jgi:hypothetical protein
MVYERNILNNDKILFNEMQQNREVISYEKIRQKYWMWDN